MNPREVLSGSTTASSATRATRTPARRAPRQGRKIAVNALGIELAGCPLDEKISEMHALRKAGDPVGALALVVLDNPMPGHRHRICNDCMKSCIFQKAGAGQHPADRDGRADRRAQPALGRGDLRPGRALEPAQRAAAMPLPYNGKNVLVVGLGPAATPRALPGERRLRRGRRRRLKIEPLPADLTGTGLAAPRPIRDWSEITASSTSACSRIRRRVGWHHRAMGQELPDAAAPDARTPARPPDVWRRAVRRTLPIEDAWTYGFDHVAVASGAGRPTSSTEEQPDPRIRKASDFDGAAAHRRLQARRAAHLQARVPAIVIGGGLTAIDTATELMAYYRCRSKRRCGNARRWRAAGEERVQGTYDAEELEVLDDLVHGRAVGPSASARPRPARPGLRLAGARVGRRDHRFASDWSIRRRTAEPRGGRQALEEGIVFAETPDRSRAGRARRALGDGLQTGGPGRQVGQVGQWVRWKTG